MPLVIPTNFTDMLKASSSRLCRCWRITRKDDVVLRFTDHDQSIVIAGDTYSPANGYSASARRLDSAFREHNTEFRGIISDDLITNADFRAGRYEGAEVLEMVIDWRVPWAGPVISSRQWIGRITWNGEAWRVELAGITRLMRKRVGEVMPRNCRHILGVKIDGIGCGVNILDFTVTGVRVDAILDGRKRSLIRANPTDLGAGFVDGWFRDGVVRFTSGLNNGIEGEIKSYESANRDIAMQIPFPFDISPNDQFEIEAGCDRLIDTCKTKFDVFDDYGGFPFFPGTDRVIQTPAAFRSRA